MCWRIVRILGDGSVKLVLESTSSCSKDMSRNYLIAKGAYGGSAPVDVTNKTIIRAQYLEPTYQKDLSMRAVFNSWFTGKFDETELRKGDWCLGYTGDAYSFSYSYGKLEQKPEELINSGNQFNYESYVNIYRKYPETATLTCKGEKVVDDYIGALTTSEVTFAGAKTGLTSGNMYLMSNVKTIWWLQDLMYFYNNQERPAAIKNGTLQQLPPTNNYEVSFRPSIILNNTMKFVSGNGTVDSAYTVSK